MVCHASSWIKLRLNACAPALKIVTMFGGSAGRMESLSDELDRARVSTVRNAFAALRSYR